MDKLNELLKELGISKVNLAKFLGVSRQMIYNYLELDDINKWPKDKKIMLFNLLEIKSSDEIDKIKIDTDYMLGVEARLNNFTASSRNETISNTEGLSKKNKELFNTLVDCIRENLEDDDDNAYYTFKYLYHYIQAMNNSRELKYMLAYVSKSIGSTKPLDFVYDEEEQFIFESIMFSAMTLYNNNGGTSRTKLAESHKRFEAQIEHKMEEKLSRTLELNSAKVQALKELNYSEINEKNAAEVIEKIAEIQARKISG